MIPSAGNKADAAKRVCRRPQSAKPAIAIQLENEFDIDLMGTESFITWMHEKFKVPGAENAWAAIKIAAGGNAPVGNEDDPVFLRK